MAKPHVGLVIDNDDDVLQELKNMLASLGHQCYCASTQEEAERILEKQGVCYVLLDLELPVRPNQLPKIQVGFNLLDRIRDTFSKEQLPIIIITAHGKDHAFSVRAFKMEANDYIKKPFDNEPEPLEDKIREATQKTCEKSHGACPNLRARRKSKQRLPLPVKGKEADGKPSEAEPARLQPAGAALGDGTGQVGIESTSVSEMEDGSRASKKTRHRGAPQPIADYNEFTKRRGAIRQEEAAKMFGSSKKHIQNLVRQERLTQTHRHLILIDEKFKTEHAAYFKAATK